VSVENALYSDPRVAEAAVVGIPHPRLGEQVAAVVSVRPANRGQLTEKGLIASAQKKSVAVCSCQDCHSIVFVLRLPKFAVPVMVLILDRPLGEKALP